MHRPVVPVAATLFAAAILQGCAAAAPACNSSSLSCLVEKARAPHFQACMDDLFWYDHRDKWERRAIDARYGYPATSADTFFDLQRMGMGAPSPSQWCDDYANRTVAVRVGDPG